MLYDGESYKDIMCDNDADKIAKHLDNLNGCYIYYVSIGINDERQLAKDLLYKQGAKMNYELSKLIDSKGA